MREVKQQGDLTEEGHSFLLWRAVILRPVHAHSEIGVCGAWGGARNG